MSIDPFKEMVATQDLMRAIKGGDTLLHDIQREQLRARYDENLRGVDAEVARVVGALRNLGLEEDTLLILTSDHGEAFLEHGFLSHGRTLYEEVVHVPLLLWGGGVEKALPKRIGDVVSTVDLYPAICRVLGVPCPGAIPGESILLLDDAPWDVVSAFSQGGFQELTHVYDPREAYWFERYKLIRELDGYCVELYDLERDGEETTNLAGVLPVLTDYLSVRAQQWRHRQNARVLEGGATEALDLNDAATKEELQALGYL